MVALLIWDAAGAPPSNDKCSTILWQGFVSEKSSGTTSILDLIEKNADVLRSRYLAWIYDFGEKRIAGRRLIEHLEFAPGFSYWWMTLLNEKCNFAKSPQIDDAIKLLAFIDWAFGKKIESITLVSKNKKLAECLRGWCEQSTLSFQWKRLPRPNKKLSLLRRIYAVLPNAVRAWAWLIKYLITWWPLRGIGIEEWGKSNGSVTFVSYLFNLSLETKNGGAYKSDYWGHLPAKLQHVGCKTNWLHLYVKADCFSEAKNTAQIIKTLNKAGDGQQVHLTLEAFLSLKVVLRAIKAWLQLAFKGVCLSGPISISICEPVNFWPLFKEDWKSSIFGQTAMFSLLQYYLFDSAMTLIPKQRAGVYLQENQGWEFGLINAWKTAGHGKLVGFPHSTVRFWDLRFFFDSRIYCQSSHNKMPLPDHVAVSGMLAANAYLAGGYRPGDLVEVEALRYLYLENFFSKSQVIDRVVKKGSRLLVLGDYLARNTKYQMRLLSEAKPLLPDGLTILVKPHPACPINPGDYPDLSIKITTESVSKILSKCDFVFTSAATSAAVDAYCSGLPVVSTLDQNSLNQSPLRGCLDVHFATSPKNLARIITVLTSKRKKIGKGRMFFNTNNNLGLWSNLLLNG